jgi:hypothetical protein
MFGHWLNEWVRTKCHRLEFRIIELEEKVELQTEKLKQVDALAKYLGVHFTDDTRAEKNEKGT